MGCESHFNDVKSNSSGSMDSFVGSEGSKIPICSHYVLLKVLTNWVRASLWGKKRVNVLNLKSKSHWRISHSKDIPINSHTESVDNTGLYSFVLKHSFCEVSHVLLSTYGLIWIKGSKRFFVVNGIPVHFNHEVSHFTQCTRSESSWPLCCSWVSPVL